MIKSLPLGESNMSRKYVSFLLSESGIYVSVLPSGQSLILLNTCPLRSSQKPIRLLLPCLTLFVYSAQFIP